MPYPKIELHLHLEGAVCDDATRAWLREIGDRYDWGSVSRAGAA